MSGNLLSKAETEVFKAWDGVPHDFGYLSFRSAAERSGVEHCKIRRAVRAISRKGLLQFEKGLWNDDGSLYGAGYGLTDAGREYLEKITDPDHSSSSP